MIKVPSLTSYRAAFRGISSLFIALLVALSVFHPAGAVPPQRALAESVVYRSFFNIRNNNASALTNFQVLVTVNTASLVSAGKMQADGRDIRFFSGATPVSYWIESGMNTAATRIWVKMPSLPAGADTLLALAYGDPALPAASNGLATFELFDDFNSFDPAKWNFYPNSGSFQVSSGTIMVTSGIAAILRSSSVVPMPAVAEMKVNSAVGDWPNIALLQAGTFNGYTGAGGWSATFLGRAETYSNSYQLYFDNGQGGYPATGIWKLTWSATGAQRFETPGKTLNLANASYPMTPSAMVAFGNLQSGAGTLVVDWIRARKHAPLEPVVTSLGTAGIKVSTITGDTTEAGGTATFNVVLDSAPTGTVTIALASSDTTEGAVSSDPLVFTGGNWSTPQQVTVTGVDDDVDDGDIAYTIDVNPSGSPDPLYKNLPKQTVSLKNTDDDTASFTVSDVSGDTTEAGGMATFTVVLNSEPVDTVTIALASSDTTEGTVASDSLTFTDETWDTPQEVTVTGIDDDVVDGDIAYEIELDPSSSLDPLYAALAEQEAGLTNIDDDVAGLSFTDVTGDTTEAGGTATFTVALTSEPVDTVTVALSSSDTTEGTVTPASLEFTDETWDTPQEVTVTGVDDDVVDGDIAYEIIANPSASLDPLYAALVEQEAGLLNTDDDVAGFTVSDISGDTSEAGGTATFTVVLNSEPVDTVTIALSSSDTTEGDVDLVSLEFTGETWDAPQEVTVTGVDDTIYDGDIPYSIDFQPAASTDQLYDGIELDRISLANTDDDLPPQVAFDNIEYEVDEDGSEATITVTLSQTAGMTTTVNYATSDGTAVDGEDYTAASGQLTFAEGEISKTFKVTILDNQVDDEDKTIDLALSDPGNATLGEPDTATLTILDDEAAELSFGQASYSVNEKDKKITITVNLSVASTSTVTVSYNTADDTAAAGQDYTSASDSLTFAPGETSKTFEVTITDDTLIEQAESFEVELSGPENAQLGTQSTAAITIISNDIPLYLPIIFR